MDCATLKLKLMPYAQAEVHAYKRGATRCLISYTTRVAELTDDGWLYVEGIPSRTTGRHITAFLKEYAPHLQNPYQIAKHLASKRMAMNIRTGELKEW